MFGLGFTELLVIGAVALLVFGPEQLPGLARALGKSARQLRDAMDEFKKEVNLPQINIKDELFGTPPRHSPKPQVLDNRETAPTDNCETGSSVQIDNQSSTIKDRADEGA